MTTENRPSEASQPDPSANPRPNVPWRTGLAVAGAAVLTAAGLAVTLRGGDDDDGDQQVAADQTTTSDDSTSPGGDPTGGDSTDPTDDGGTDDTTDPSGGDGGTGGPTIAIDRYRVRTAAVAADAADPYLNLRLSPGSGGDLLAKLPATYTGLAATGRTETAADGGTWVEVELLHPVAVTTVERDTGRPPAGWVNASFVEALPGGLAVTTDEVPACAGGFERIDTGSGLATGYLHGMDSALVEPGCLRVVLTFGEGTNVFDWRTVPEGTAPAGGLPEVFNTMSGGLGATFELGAVTGAWPGATDTGDGVYAVRAPDHSVDLVIPAPVRGVTETGLPERGIVVIDLELGEGDVPPSGAGVVLTRRPQTWRGTIEVVGLSRPFEANLGVHLEDGAGQPVSAVFSGSDFLGTVETDEYGVGTTDWLEVWGTFAVRVEGLDAGDYTLVLDPDGGSDTPRTLRLPLTIDEGDDPPSLANAADQQMIMELVGFANTGVGANADRVPLADEIALYLGATLHHSATRAELADPEAWVIDVEGGFGGFDGPFSALDQLQRQGLRFTAGPVPFCAGPPKDWPAELDDLRQVNIEPIGIDSCIAWFGVHLYLDASGEIAAVGLDMFGP